VLVPTRGTTATSSAFQPPRTGVIPGRIGSQKRRTSSPPGDIETMVPRTRGTPRSGRRRTGHHRPQGAGRQISGRALEGRPAARARRGRAGRRGARVTRHARPARGRAGARGSERHDRRRGSRAPPAAPCVRTRRSSTRVCAAGSSRLDVPATDYLAAQRFRRWWQRQVLELLDPMEVDLP